MRMLRTLCCAAALAITTIAMLPAQATADTLVFVPLTWNVNGTLQTFEGSPIGSVTGTFTNEGDTITAVDLTVDDGGFISIFDDSGEVDEAFLPGSLTLIDDFGADDVTGNEVLALIFTTAALDGSESSIPLNESSFFGQCADDECLSVGVFAEITGDVSLVPLPAAAWFFLTALGGLAGLARSTRGDCQQPTTT